MNLLQLLTFISVQFVLPVTVNDTKHIQQNHIRKRQSAYICGVEPYRFYSDIPCTYYPMCVNGGMMVNVGCSTDTTCRLYNANWVCIQGCCCTIPRFYTPTSFYPMNSTPAIDFNKLYFCFIVLIVYLQHTFTVSH